MKSELIKATLEVCRIESETDTQAIESLPWAEVVEKYILPRLVMVGGQDVRGWRIGDTFMQFMADHGQDCLSCDRATGELLMELAMQRLSCGAIVHAPYHLVASLPAQYQKYSAAYDQYGILSQACVNFIQANLMVCCRLDNPIWRKHAHLILWGILDNFDTDGTVHLLFNQDLLTTNPADIAKMAEDMAVDVFSLYVVCEQFAPIWRRKKSFFRQYAEQIDWEMDLFFYLNLVEEAEELGITPWKVRYLGCMYRTKVKNQIKKEIGV